MSNGARKMEPEHRRSSGGLPPFFISAPPRRGFSLVEVMVTVAVLAILLAGVGFTSVSGSGERARMTEFRCDAAMLVHGTAIYRHVFGVQPRSASDLWKEGIMLGENSSPWGTPYALVMDRSGLVSVRAQRDTGKDVAEIRFRD